ncbi:diacylglycerol kinase (ATP) [Caloranaerobacter azorensis DSM 13643]|uniref:Diacylglycerol kinase (ATP) n=1 Tax=Caloranaerobacter azorensis DSM 13643 TaxID=1121264 RepID=A0A1M5S8H7_9FIRM|nr:diacylglycerol kinase [Caloranaerobacter azorensis]SHH34745.1 diacylglycerol kinase (ATP) [Caloranaerobacter azorensis DSM 13643]
MKVRRLIDSFNYAVSGIIYTLKTQRNMKIHFISAFLVLFLSLFLNFSRMELLLLIFAISLVIIAEMINTSIEKTIDLITNEYHPLAEIAKNVAAGAVLISAINSIVVAYLLLFDRVNPYTSLIIMKIKNSPIHLTFISIFLILIVTIYVKTLTKTGTPFKGGLVSGHAAVAFATATAITFIGENTLVATLSFLIAFLVGQSRIEGGIHSTSQVFFGALLGILLTVLVFQFIG